jgi:hypothetical protein
MKKTAFIILILFTALIFSCSCKKDKDTNVNDLFNFQIRTLDSNGVETTNFQFGSNIVFEIDMINKTDNTINYYMGLQCAQLYFRVYKNDSLIGDPNNGHIACEDVLIEYNILPNESKKASISWFVGHPNQPLRKGNYFVEFKSEISLRNSSNNWEKSDIEAKKNFTIN